MVANRPGRSGWFADIDYFSGWHELGHAIAAVRNGVKVEEFGIGFPPLAKKLGQVKGVDVTLNWLPIGGFCRMRGGN